MHPHGAPKSRTNSVWLPLLSLFVKLRMAYCLFSSYPGDNVTNEMRLFNASFIHVLLAGNTLKFARENGEW